MFDDFGQFGAGSAGRPAAPVAVDTSGVLAGKTLIQISAGPETTCAVDAAGTACCWGQNAYGGFGDGSTAGSGWPVVAGGPQGPTPVPAFPAAPCLATPLPHHPVARHAPPPEKPPAP
jgi:hypothetical protein